MLASAHAPNGIYIFHLRTSTSASLQDEKRGLCNYDDSSWFMCISAFLLYATPAIDVRIGGHNASDASLKVLSKSLCFSVRELSTETTGRLSFRSSFNPVSRSDRSATLITVLRCDRF